MKKTIILWSLYTFSLAIANVLQAGGSPWDPRGEKTDKMVGEENQAQLEEME